MPGALCRASFSIGSDPPRRARPSAAHRLLSILLLLPAFLIAACGQQGGYSQYGNLPYGTGESSSLAPSHYYPPPGPPDDPWGPYIREAASRYSVPEQWVRAVMQQESGGQEQAVSPVGAMGLMQVMPETYAGLQARYGLGDDPYDPHNNILAGTAYIREMYDRFGAPGFLAAYNAGPDRVNGYLAGTAELPDETVNYLAAVTPNLGGDVALSGPLATYASAGTGRGYASAPDVASLAAGCDLSAAYDPDHPCTSLMRAATTPAPVQQAFLQPQTGVGGCDLSAAYDPDHPCTSAGQAAAMSAPPSAQQATIQQAFVAPTGATGCDLSAAYDPNHPCTSAGQPAAMSAPPPQLVAEHAAGECDPNAAYDPDHPCQPLRQASTPIQLASAAGNASWPPVTAEPISTPTSFASDRFTAPRPVPSAALGGGHLLTIPDRNWAIQVGAFANPALARSVAEGARAEAPDQLRAATLALPPTPAGGSVLYRARLAHLSASAASDACWRLNQRQLPCVVVQPSRS
jgi:hypothetical protein